MSKLGWLFRRKAFHREMEEEIAFHMNRVAEDLEERGMSPEQARREARIRFGNPDSVAERTHLSAAFAWESAFHDFRYALRILKKNRILTTVVEAHAGCNLTLSCRGLRQQQRRYIGARDQ